MGNDLSLGLLVAKVDNTRVEGNSVRVRLAYATIKKLPVAWSCQRTDQQPRPRIAQLLWLMPPTVRCRCKSILVPPPLQHCYVLRAFSIIVLALNHPRQPWNSPGAHSRSSRAVPRTLPRLGLGVRRGGLPHCQHTGVLELRVLLPDSFPVT